MDTWKLIYKDGVSRLRRLPVRGGAYLKGYLVEHTIVEWEQEDKVSVAFVPLDNWDTRNYPLGEG